LDRVFSDPAISCARGRRALWVAAGLLAYAITLAVS